MEYPVRVANKGDREDRETKLEIGDTKGRVGQRVSGKKWFDHVARREYTIRYYLL
jgi:hypothetical protein